MTNSRQLYKLFVPISMGKLYKILFVLVAMVSFCLGAVAQTQISELRCEYLSEPLGIDTPAPRYTWIIEADNQFEQQSYRLSVATTPELLKKGKADVWISTRVQSATPASVYTGQTALQPHSKYYWCVEVWSRSGKHLSSKIASFETAKMKPSDWSASWISDTFDKEFRKAPLLRKTFEMRDKQVESARVYVSGVGYYEMYINGDKVGDHVLDPGYTHFDKRVLYATYDVSNMLQAKDNVISTVLGNGWLNVQALSVWNFEKARWRMRPRMMAELRVVYTDGDVQTIVTDKSWRTNTGAYIYNNLYSGDVYDARLDRVGWKSCGYDDSNWREAQMVAAPAPIVKSQQMPPIRVLEQVKPISVRKFDDNIYVYDMGQNMTGVCRLNFSGKAGTCVKIRHGELVYDNGRLNQSNIDVYFQREKNGMPQHKDPFETLQEDVYFMCGDKIETFEPKFTYHGFRYVEVECTKPVEMDINSLTGLYLHTDVESVGNFECSNPKLNKLFEASRRSYLCNLHSIPTDCPQREKNGWTADGYVAMDYGLLNFDGITVYEKWLNDFVDNQTQRGDISGIIPSAGWGYADWIGPVWDASLFIVANNLHLYYGDTRAIETVYPTCKRYLEYLQTREKDGKLTYGIGDWVFYKAKTDTQFTSTAFYWKDNVIMAKFATLLGEDPSPYIQKADQLKKLINDTWFDADKNIYANSTQAAQAVALALGFVPAGHEQSVADKLVEMIRRNEHQLDFGMLGSKFVPAMLSRYGYAGDAYKMITRPNAPSWMNWIERGLTTLPETWVLDKDFKDASLNHAFLGDVSAWMVNSLAGINYDVSNPGFESVIISPAFIEELDWVRGEYRSVRGLIESEWVREGDKIKLKVTIPANVKATLVIDKPVKLKSGVNSFTL